MHPQHAIYGLNFCNALGRNKKELAFPGNQGLQIAVDLLKPIKDKYSNITYAGES